MNQPAKQRPHGSSRSSRNSSGSRGCSSKPGYRLRKRRQPQVLGLTRIHLRRWRKLKTIDKNPLRISFEGANRNYFVQSVAGFATLRAREKNGDIFWSTRLPGPFPAAAAEVEWTIQESGDLKQGLVTRIGNGRRMIFQISTETGTVLTHNLGPAR